VNALLLAAALVAAPVVSHGDVTTIVQQDPSVPLVHVDFVLRAGLDREQLTQNGLAALTAQSLLESPVQGTSLADAVAAAGGSIAYTVDGNDVRYDIGALPEDAPRVFGLVESALRAPAFDATTVNAARDVLDTRIAVDQEQALQVGIDMLAQTATASANTGLPQFGSPASLAQLGPNDVKRFFSTYYVRGGAYVSAVGRTDALGSAGLQALADALPAGSTSPIAVTLPKLVGASRHLVAERNITSPWLIAQYPAPAIGSKDFGAMLVLSAFMQRTLSDMVQMPGVVSPTFASHAIGAVYQFDNPRPNLMLYVNGGIGDPNRSFLTALSIANILSSTRLQGSIDDFKTMAQGDFISSSQSLSTRAWLAVVFEENGGQPDYVTRTLDAISHTSAADLQRVASHYLGSPTIALILPRESS
jgi:predicted Zn-dependent peptidase